MWPVKKISQHAIQAWLTMSWAFSASNLDRLFGALLHFFHALHLPADQRSNVKLFMTWVIQKISWKGIKVLNLKPWVSRPYFNVTYRVWCGRENRYQKGPWASLMRPAVVGGKTVTVVCMRSSLPLSLAVSAVFQMLMEEVKMDLMMKV